MPVFLIGEGGGGGPPFDRLFFSVTLGEILARHGGPDSRRLTLYLTDGTTLEACKIEALKENFLIVRGYRGDLDVCDETIHVIAYGLVYRLEIAPKASGSERLGFTWTAPKNGPP